MIANDPVPELHIFVWEQDETKPRFLGSGSETSLKPKSRGRVLSVSAVRRRKIDRELDENGRS